MRHQCKKHTLGKAKDQRDALLRALATELILHGEINTTMSRAKALRPYVESIISFAKKGDLHSRRMAARFIYDRLTGEFMDPKTQELIDTPAEGQKTMPETVLRKLFAQIGKKFSNRNGGYTRIYRMPPRRGDGTVMALIQLV